MNLFEINYKDQEDKFREQHDLIYNGFVSIQQSIKSSLDLQGHYFLLNNEYNKPYDPIYICYERERTPSMVSTISTCLSDDSTSTQDSVQYFNLSERDSYGFKRSLWIKPIKVLDFEQRYQRRKEKQQRNWNKLYLNNNNQWPTLCPQLNRYVQKGIPKSMRSKVWLHYSGAQERMNQNPGLYDSLLELTVENNKYIELINKDLHRLFPDNIYFYNESYEHSKLPSLRRLLTAFTFFSSDIGYSTPLGHLAGFLLLVFDNEEEAFWLLVTLIQDYFPQGMWLLDGAQIEQTVLMMMIYERLPSIWSKVANKKCFWEYENDNSLPSVHLLTNHWFSTLFVNSLPIETVLRIWDCFLVGGGFKVLYQVALTLLKLNEKRMTDSVEAVQVLQSMPKQLIDCDEFVKCIFSSHNDFIVDIIAEEIETKRTLIKNRKIQREGH